MYIIIISTILYHLLPFSLAEEAALRMVRLLGSELFIVKTVQGKSITIIERVSEEYDDDNDCSDNDDDSDDLNIGIGNDNGNNHNYDNDDKNENFSLSSMNCRNSTLNNNNSSNNNRNNSNNENNYDATETKSEEYIDTATRFRGEECPFNPGKKSDAEKLKLLRLNKNGRKRRTLKLEFGNMFDVKNIRTADIVMLETDIPNELHRDLCLLLSNMKLDSRTLTYLDLRKTWSNNIYFPYRQLENNKNLSDRFPTSWSVQRGHHFYVWNKVNYVD